VIGLLTELIAAPLSHQLADGAARSAAQYLVSGNLLKASELSGIGSAQLATRYLQVFNQLSLIVMAITLISALLVWLCLRGQREASCNRQK